MNQKMVTGKLEQIIIGLKSNLFYLKTTDNQWLEFTDWNKFPLKQGETYTVTYFESGGFLNPIVVTDSIGKKLEIDKKHLIENILSLTTSLQFKLKQELEVL